MVDSLITLFPSNATDFSTNGYGCLSETISCIVTEERNGIFELTLKYPVDGRYYSLLTDNDMRKIIYVKPNPYDNKQAFRIYDISTPMNGIITINAAHISYDLSGFLLKPFTGTKTLQQAFDYFVDGSSVLPSMHNFSFTNGMIGSTESSFSLKKAATIRSMLGGEEGSILDLYKGEYKFDNFNIYLYSQRGQNSGVSIRYGKNLTDMDHDKACDGMYTGVYPYFYRENNYDDGTFKNVTSIEGNIQYIEGYSSSSDFRKIYPLDCTSDFSNVPEDPTEDEKASIKSAMEQKAIDFIANNEIGKPKVSIDVSFVSLEQSEEFEQYKDLYTVKLCDTVNIYYPKLNINATEKCIKTVYNVLLGKYDSIELGEGRSNLVDQVASQNAAISDTAQSASQMTQDFISKMIAVTNLILNNKGGILEFEYDSNNHPTTMKIYVTDPQGSKTDDYWIFNSSGLGFYNHNTGYMNVALDKNGGVTATNVDAATIRGAYIYGGTVDSATIKGTTIQGTTIDGTCHVSSSGGMDIKNSWDQRDTSPYLDFYQDRESVYPWGAIGRIYSKTIAMYGQHGLVAMPGISSSSDRRLKYDIKDLNKDYEQILNLLTPKQFRLEPQGGYLNLGFIAQDVRDVIRELNLEDAIFSGDEKKCYMALDYNQFIPILWSIVKDLKDRVEKIENQNKGD